MSPATTMAETIVPLTKIKKPENVLDIRVTAYIMAAYRPDFHAWISLALMGRTQLGGFIRLNNFSTIRRWMTTRRCFLHLFTYKRKPCGGINGMSSLNQMCSGRSLLVPCVSTLDLWILKILTKLLLSYSKLELYESIKCSLST